MVAIVGDAGRGESLVPVDRSKLVNVLQGLDPTSYYSQGKLSDAEPLMMEAPEIFRRALPEGHPHVRQVEANLQILRASMQQRSGESGV